MNKILLSFTTVVSLCGASAFAMDDVSLSSDHQKHTPLCVFSQQDLVRKTPTCPSVKKESEETTPLNFLNLLPDLQEYTLLQIIDQKDLLSMTATCQSLQAAGKNSYEKIWSKNRLLSVMPKELPTTWESPASKSYEVFREKKWGLCSENKNYLMWGKLLQVIFKEAVVDNKTTSELWKNMFDIRHPTYNEALAANNEDYKESMTTSYRICEPKNLGKRNYQQIGQHTLFEAFPFKAPGEARICTWHIKGQYLSGVPFSLEICNVTLADQEGSEDSDD